MLRTPTYPALIARHFLVPTVTAAVAVEPSAVAASPPAESLQQPIVSPSPVGYLPSACPLARSLRHQPHLLVQQLINLLLMPFQYLFPPMIMSCILVAKMV